MSFSGARRKALPPHPLNSSFQECDKNSETNSKGSSRVTRNRSHSRIRPRKQGIDEKINLSMRFSHSLCNLLLEKSLSNYEKLRRFILSMGSDYNLLLYIVYKAHGRMKDYYQVDSAAFQKSKQIFELNQRIQSLDADLVCEEHSLGQFILAVSQTPEFSLLLQNVFAFQTDQYGENEVAYIHALAISLIWILVHLNLAQRCHVCVNTRMDCTLCITLIRVFSSVLQRHLISIDFSEPIRQVLLSILVEDIPVFAIQRDIDKPLEAFGSLVEHPELWSFIFNVTLGAPVKFKKQILNDLFSLIISRSQNGMDLFCSNGVIKWFKGPSRIIRSLFSEKIELENDQTSSDPIERQLQIEEIEETIYLALAFLKKVFTECFFEFREFVTSLTAAIQYFLLHRMDDIASFLLEEIISSIAAKITVLKGSSYSDIAWTNLSNLSIFMRSYVLSQLASIEKPGTVRSRSSKKKSSIKDPLLEALFRADPHSNDFRTTLKKLDSSETELFNVDNPNTQESLDKTMSLPMNLRSKILQPMAQKRIHEHRFISRFSISKDSDTKIFSYYDLLFPNLAKKSVENSQEMKSQDPLSRTMEHCVVISKDRVLIERLLKLLKDLNLHSFDPLTGLSSLMKMQPNLDDVARSNLKKACWETVRLIEILVFLYFIEVKWCSLTGSEFSEDSFRTLNSINLSGSGKSLASVINMAMNEGQNLINKFVEEDSSHYRIKNVLNPLSIMESNKSTLSIELQKADHLLHFFCSMSKTKKLTTTELVKQIRTEISRGTRMYKFRNYENCFTASDLCQYLVDHKIVHSNFHANFVGIILRSLRIIDGIARPGQAFSQSSHPIGFIEDLSSLQQQNSSWFLNDMFRSGARKIENFMGTNSESRSRSVFVPAHSRNSSIGELASTRERSQRILISRDSDEVEDSSILHSNESSVGDVVVQQAMDFVKLRNSKNNITTAEQEMEGSDEELQRILREDFSQNENEDEFIVDDNSDSPGRIGSWSRGSRRSSASLKAVSAISINETHHPALEDLIRKSIQFDRAILSKDALSHQTMFRTSYTKKPDD